MAELPLYRLYALRALFLLIGLGEGLQIWPAIFHHARPWEFWHGVSMSFLGALTALSLLGVRYPIKMMPLLFFELAWKGLWVLAVFLPLWLAHRVDADTAGTSLPSGSASCWCRSFFRGVTFGDSTSSHRPTVGNERALSYRVELRQRIPRQFHRGAGDILAQMRDRRGAGNQQNIRRAPQQPR
jgi:hypothetical protein